MSVHLLSPLDPGHSQPRAATEAPRKKPRGLAGGFGDTELFCTPTRELLLRSQLCFQCSTGPVSFQGRTPMLSYSGSEAQGDF